jgi:Trypsin-like peptidase domain
MIGAVQPATRLNLKRGGVLALTAFSLAGCAGLHSGLRLRGLTPTEKMMWSTYAVGTRRGLATGFVVLRRDAQAPGGVVPVVVTAAHLLNTAPKGPFYLALRLRDDAGNLQVAALELQPTTSKVPAYMRHPRYDVAALELRLPLQVAKLVPLPSFLDEQSIGRRGDRPRVGQDVSFLGFPDVFPGTAGAFPVLRGGKIASYAASAPGRPQPFLIHTNVYPGDSGGPVFTARERGKPKLVGMLTRGIRSKARTAVALAVAVDAQAIRETLQLLAERERSPAQDLQGSPAAPATSARASPLIAGQLHQSFALARTDPTANDGVERPRSNRRKCASENSAFRPWRTTIRFSEGIRNIR